MLPSLRTEIPTGNIPDASKAPRHPAQLRGHRRCKERDLYRGGQAAITVKRNGLIGVCVSFLALSAIACGDSPTGPSSGTRIEAVVQDAPGGGPTATGTLAGNVHASVGTSDQWVDIGSPNGITVPLQIAGRTTTIHGEASVASASYNRVRLVFQGVSARLASGSNVGGTVLASDRTIIVGGSDERVEISLPVNTFSVEANTSVRQVITFELRSQQWLTAAAVQAGRVEDSAIQAAVSATVGTENR